MEDRVLSRLIEMTNHSDAEVKAAAIEALGESAPKTERVISLLLEKSRHTSHVVKIAAAKALGKLSAR
ncbi:HEAT repeat domain-containing protein [Citrobacter amalonaticus]|uniref:HEAT repeat domain-containing protein n=1 Tax=Citrobacter amalonaticus TaxID=35703 RepID=UPI001907C5FD|nr:HEAT repeat domain-containing protein [Citrobacter amalonaticus]MBJ9259735.1 HEAT repeat domain-containing protein [Citrobacter amalonaticus]